MARVDVRRLAWAVNRWFLIRGAGAWVIAAGTLCLLWALLLTAGSLRHHVVMKERLQEHDGLAPDIAVDEGPASPIFPYFAERFDHTVRMFEALGIDESLAGKATLAWDRSPDSALVTQTLILNMQAPWEQVGATLDRVQTAVPTAYIARLGLSRDTSLDARVETELRITLVYRDPAQEGVR